jgi:hypothetical protein
MHLDETAIWSFEIGSRNKLAIISTFTQYACHQFKIGPGNEIKVRVIIN